MSQTPVELNLDDIDRYIAEDLGSGDLTADVVPASVSARAEVVTRESMVLCGQAWFEAVFRRLDPAVRVIWLAEEGAEVSAADRVCEVEGNARALLSGERTALNLLQTLSGTATIARRYAQAVAGTGVKVLDTRKTLPGLRLAQKYAVRCGGCHNHRAGLYDAVLIKENHIAAAGSIGEAVATARRLHPGVLVEVEVENFPELEQALAAGADRIMLDDFERDALSKAVAVAAGRAELEVSGSIDLDSIRAVAETGVDFISVGGLTKHLRAIDLSMRIALLG
ncbi:nicotinate-nucleotide pyrophosphorylase [Methylococcus capsulatus str. Bath]|uniref:Probable nicotinate-nucleotide pyrophosphorylase [carboxylating] n=1 Tax=Methylococcus capsulatus (strain ATCC 33009 / NCIMB 11132 / Bath) TaxID=243233 RepID=Q602G2_METCA|nr:carboxylating nicotinate-nucleotide diphosphorylase [Methylococcus capsulatus]AAU90791.1 nicotinate-nucleotide pyrophosphorylase [Methylococcus capsulatus str. Bath]UQN11449.1 carboxylating nicotinate-nucleotide diphosphorylase [Methylococcus capsulatus]